MDYQPRQAFTTKLREFSFRTLGLGALFIITAVTAIFVDLDGVLEYFKILSGSPGMTLETGAFISIASAVPFLAMGMSISADGYRTNWRK